MLARHQGVLFAVLGLVLRKSGNLDGSCPRRLERELQICSLLLFIVLPTAMFGTEPSFYDIPPDITLPSVVTGEPQAGKRVRATTAGWETTSVYHTVYLPDDWTPNSRLPVFVEYPGNGGFKRGLDSSHGTVEGCALGYGVTSGKAIWICLPFVDKQDGFKQNCTLWWGDIEEAKRYCIATVQDVCSRLGGDSDRVFLGGFSRGAIACGFIGLHDDRIASLWTGFLAHSHFDGMRENWPYAGADRASARQRLQRLGRRPVWISGEGGIAETKKYLEESGIDGDWTFVPFPYPHHTALWTLRDLPIRTEARAWWDRVSRAGTQRD